MNHNEKGFTLIESLLVLSILTIITSIVILQLKPLHDSRKIDFFLEQLQDDIFYSQQYAISHSEQVNVIFNENDHNYHIRSGKRNVIILDREYDESIQIDYATLGTTLTFNANGNIRKSGTIRVKYKDAIYKITFLLGKGRFYVAKM
ncbi:competence type IV pilus minor pilin ComGD [Fredinandcohnia quinoae]|uniref:Type II secretion system GspH family protein n=1 Tax=Fredinandcohnia quinoae TaxID=2918902 RepID=A0AAW5DW96_9BACI|nr:competence type IV pilus minor pilin ComGD [Fredinandcohnia sp. SECRCQ15]MCH1624915.1 type II secretion system GspH family protein [Fredinandcohnia sp. SECRCQ15]